MKIAICDDDPRDGAHLVKCVRAHDAAHEVSLFQSGRAFLTQFYDGVPFDLLFLDVQMPDENGWDIAKEIKRLNQKLFIAMVTVHGDYIFDCFDRVDWFAAKPVDREKVWRILDNAKERLYPTVLEFVAERGEQRVVLNAAEIFYIEVRHNEVLLYTAQKIHTLRMTFAAAKAVVATAPQFVQVHRSYMVNLDYYDHMEGSDLVLKDQTRIKLSRGYRQRFFEALQAYIRQGGQ